MSDVVPSAHTKLLDAFTPPTDDDWRQAAERLLKGASVDERLRTPTPEGITLRPIYGAGDRPEGIGGALPGAPPYLRGSGAAGYRSGSWSVDQRVTAASADAFNRAVRDDLARGATSVQVPLVEAEGADGWAGVGPAVWRADRLDDLDAVLAGVELSETPVVMHTPGSGLAPLAALLALADRRGVHPGALRGGVEADPLAGLAVRGRLPCGVERLFDDMAEATRHAADRAPALSTIGLSGMPFADGGAHAVQELALVLAGAAEVLGALADRGVSTDVAAPRVSVTVSVGSQLVMEIAKLRALRLLWARVAQAFGGGSEAQRVRVRARSAGWNRSMADPVVNALRATTEGFAAVIGQAEAIELTPFDAVAGTPGERAHRLARNTQLILRDEARLTSVIDPAGGSAAIESLTDDLARRAWRLFQQVEEQGGLIAALVAGGPQAAIAETVSKRREALARARDVLVGVNRYADPSETMLAPADASGAPPAGNRASADTVPSASAELSDESTRFADTERSLVEAAVAALGAGASLSHLAAARHLGASPAAEPIRPLRGAEPFERVRRRAEAHRAATGSLPTAVLVGVGPAREVRPRVDFCRGVLGVGGFEPRDAGIVADADGLRAILADGDERVVVLCLPAGAEPSARAAQVAAARAARPGARVLLAGEPPPGAEGEADAHLHRGMDLVATLDGLLDALGVEEVSA
ncbi:acyl-CoA mutase large subunit family protein [Gaopeijia maritima]|uniref:Acyl-CoA mutase large subunit family protein n=1 Tax=Gaopeijia maritima TaxID=3119007 RepID=A0ABU9ECD3_9BACT